MTGTLKDSMPVPFEDASFDVVYCNDSFHHYPAPDEVLGEVFRVLKPGGTFLMCDSWHPGLGGCSLMHGSATAGRAM